MERRRFSQAMASEWQTAFVVFHKMTWCVCSLPSRIITKVLKKLQDFFFKTKTKCSRPRPRLHDPRRTIRPRLSFLSSRRLETKTLVHWFRYSKENLKIHMGVPSLPSLPYLPLPFFISPAFLSLFPFPSLPISPSLRSRAPIKSS